MRGNYTQTSRTSRRLGSRLRSLRPRLLCIASAVVLGLTLVFGAGSASALKAHPSLTASFGSDGTSGTSFPAAISVDIDQAARKLYVFAKTGSSGSSGSSYIYGFDISTPGANTPLASFSPFTLPEENGYVTSKLGVDNTNLPTAGTVYAVVAPQGSGDTIYSVSPAGTPPGGNPFATEPVPGADLVDVTVDPSGNVWASTGLGTTSTKLVEYSSSGTLLRTVTIPGSVRMIQFDAAGNLYVAGTDIALVSGFQGSIWKYSAPSYETPVKFLSGVENLFTIDHSTGELYVLMASSNVREVRRYSASGQLLETIPLGGQVGLDIAVDEVNSDLYIPVQGNKVLYFKSLELPLPITGVASNPSTTSVTLNGTVRTDGVTLTDCHFEYVTEAAFQASGFSDLSSGGSAPCTPAAGSIPLDSKDHSVSAAVSGLSATGGYRFRLVAENANGKNTGKDASFALGDPILETVGAPVRTTSTAQLNGRIFPHGLSSTFHFDYVTDSAFQASGFADLSSGGSTPAQPAGVANSTELVAEEIEGLSPDTTYHYRLVADNGGSPVSGNEMTVTTRASDAPLSHGHFSGPPGSDRAYELVSIPDSSGNPVSQAGPFAEDGNRAIFQISGGTSISNTGNFINFYYSERTPSGWKTSFLSPPRGALPAAAWNVISNPSDLSSLGAQNKVNAGSSFWNLRPDAPAQKLFETSPQWPLFDPENVHPLIATESSRTIVPLKGGEPDPAFPAAAAHGNLYDVSSGTPKLISLLPDGNPAPCGIEGGSAVDNQSNPLSADGSSFFFSLKPSCESSPQLYLRDLEADQTKLVSGPSVSGPECTASLIKVTAGAAFFWTPSRLDPADTEPADCGGVTDGDVYRYELGNETLQCLTCVVPGTDADVFSGLGRAIGGMAVADDGSRLYFQSTRSLVPGASSGKHNLYVLELGTGDLRWVTSFGGTSNESFSEISPGAAISHDGSSIRFYAKDASLNPIGGQDNGGLLQYYRYDDRDRSLLCVSCPQDDSVPGLEATLSPGREDALSDDGALIFATANALLPADQNTPRSKDVDSKAGIDVYEWRDGRLFLITDGLTEWPAGELAELPPVAFHIDRSGRDVFFVAGAQYTPDAVDGFGRLYDARIGGGIEFPKPPPPCSLEVCQGTPKGVPEERVPGTGTFSGAGNAHQPAARHHKKQKKQKHKKRHQHKANHNRRAHR